MKETEEYTIGIAEKEQEQKSIQQATSNAQKLRKTYWTSLLTQLEQNSFPLYRNISPGQDQGLAAGSGVGGISYVFIFGKNIMRVELYISRTIPEENKMIFDGLLQQRETIEAVMGEVLEWQRLDDKKACRIKLKKSVNGFEEANWSEMRDWHCIHMKNFESAICDPLASIARASLGP